MKSEGMASAHISLSMVRFKFTLYILKAVFFFNFISRLPKLLVSLIGAILCNILCWFSVWDNFDGCVPSQGVISMAPFEHILGMAIWLIESIGKTLGQVLYRLSSNRRSIMSKQKSDTKIEHALLQLHYWWLLPKYTVISILCQSLFVRLETKIVISNKSLPFLAKTLREWDTETDGQKHSVWGNTIQNMNFTMSSNHDNFIYYY